MSDEDDSQNSQRSLDDEQTEESGSVTLTNSQDVSQENSEDESLTLTDEGEEEEEEGEGSDEEGEEVDSEEEEGSLEETKEGDDESERESLSQVTEDETGTGEGCETESQATLETEQGEEDEDEGQSQSESVETSTSQIQSQSVPETVTPPATPPTTTKQEEKESDNTLTPPQPTASTPELPAPHTDTELATETMVHLDSELKLGLHVRDRLRTLEGHAIDMLEHKQEELKERKYQDARTAKKQEAVEEANTIVRAIEKKKKKKEEEEDGSPKKKGLGKLMGEKKPGLFGLQKHNLMMMARAKRVAKKTKVKARGVGHKAYRCRLEILHKGKYRPAWMVFKNGLIRCHATKRQKVVNNVGATSIEWPVGKVLVELNVSGVEAYVSVIPENVKPNAVKISTTFNSIYFGCENATMRDRFLKGIQQVVKFGDNRPGAGMMKSVICCCCGVKGVEYLPAPEPAKMWLAAPFYLASKMICVDCSEENDETGRRELAANVLNPKRRVGDGTCHSQMKMWTPALPYKSCLPRGANFDSYARETKSRCIDVGVEVPAVRVNLIELGKKRAKQEKRGVDGRLEDLYEWRRKREANFVVEKFTVKDLTKS